MAKGQAITKEEMVEVLKEAFVGFREVTKDDMTKAFVGFREVIKKDTTDLIRTEVPKILAVEVPKILLDFHAKVEEPMTEEILSRLDSVEGRIDRLEAATI